MLCKVISLDGRISRAVEYYNRGTDMLDDEQSTDALPKVLAFVNALDHVPPYSKNSFEPQKSE
jgi:hypothetical protein